MIAQDRLDAELKWKRDRVVYSDAPDRKSGR